jgi:hypothetical protein
VPLVPLTMSAALEAAKRKEISEAPPTIATVRPTMLIAVGRG